MVKIYYENQPTRKTGRAEEVYEDLKKKICILHYEPGTVLREVDLAKEFGVSRTPVRQALQRLQIEGLVESKKAVGTIVTGYSLEAINDTYSFRIKLLEWLGEDEAGPFSEKDIEDMKALLQRSANISLVDNSEEWWDINCILHDILGRSIKNKIVKNLFHVVYYQTARNWFSLVPWAGEVHKERVLSEIREMIRCMEVGDRKGVFLVRRAYVIQHFVQNRKHINHTRDGKMVNGIDLEDLNITGL